MYELTGRGGGGGKRIHCDVSHKHCIPTGQVIHGKVPYSHPHNPNPNPPYSYPYLTMNYMPPTVPLCFQSQAASLIIDVSSLLNNDAENFGPVKVEEDSRTIYTAASNVLEACIETSFRFLEEGNLTCACNFWDVSIQKYVDEEAHLYLEFHSPFRLLY